MSDINLLYNKNHNKSWFHFFIYSGFWFSSVFCNLSVRWKNQRKTEFWKFDTIMYWRRRHTKILMFVSTFWRNHILHNVSDTKCESLKGRSDPKRQHNKNEKVTGKKIDLKLFQLRLKKTFKVKIQYLLTTYLLTYLKSCKVHFHFLFCKNENRCYQDKYAV